jgi:MinD-like ATPase involved in chromosome partitioning or flagellar assembly
LGLPVLREIAEESEGVSQSLLEGAPVLVTAPTSAFSRAIRHWAADLSGIHPVEESLWTSFKQLWRAA